MTDVSDYQNYARDIAVRAGIDPDIFSALIESESSWNPNAVSRTGATGIAQFTRSTARQYGLTDRSDPYASMDAAAQYMKDLLQRFGGDYYKSISAYKGVSVGGAKPSDVRKVLDSSTNDAPQNGSQRTAVSLPEGSGDQRLWGDWSGGAATGITAKIGEWFDEQGPVVLLFVFALVVMVMSTVHLVNR